MKPHWYRIYIDECPLCGCGREHRERVYGEKPEDPQDRYVFTFVACVDHFL